MGCFLGDEGAVYSFNCLFVYASSRINCPKIIYRYGEYTLYFCERFNDPPTDADYRSPGRDAIYRVSRFIASMQRFRVNSWEGIFGDYPHRKLNKQSFILHHANESKTHQKNYAITGDNFPLLANP